ncbi:MAG: TIGR02466 family protein [Pseudomonadota bacterium]
MEIASLFATQIYRARLSETVCTAELETSCLAIAEDDDAGHDWCEENGYPGYTSYASLSDLPWRFPIFADVVNALDAHVAKFADQLHLDLGGKALELESIWINVLPEGGSHSSHIHPGSVISGTTYVAMPGGTSSIRFEDPRLGFMMGAPPRQADAPDGAKPFVYLAPAAGEVLLWESWLRHEVPMNMAHEDRISVSFNYSWT